MPAEIGLAQAMLESGLNGRARSPVRALGFCQWLPRNWNRLKRLSPYVIEGYNQTTQAPFCAAYLTALATMYGSYIPALSEHHAGGTNVGRVVINGRRLGGMDQREQYLMGSDFARGLRQVSIRRYRELFRTYGPRSALYAEMVFGNGITIAGMMEEMPQERIFAMRAPRGLPISEVMAKSGLSRDDVRRYNPALVRRVPARRRRLPAGVRAGVRPGRLVLAPSGASGLRRRAQRVRAAERAGGALVRSGLRADHPGFPGTLRGHELRGRHDHGECARLPGSRTCGRAAAPPS